MKKSILFLTISLSLLCQGEEIRSWPNLAYCTAKSKIVTVQDGKSKKQLFSSENMEVELKEQDGKILIGHTKLIIPDAKTEIALDILFHKNEQNVSDKNTLTVISKVKFNDELLMGSQGSTDGRKSDNSISYFVKLYSSENLKISTYQESHPKKSFDDIVQALYPGKEKFMDSVFINCSVISDK